MYIVHTSLCAVTCMQDSRDASAPAGADRRRKCRCRLCRNLSFRSTRGYALVQRKLRCTGRPNRSATGWPCAIPTNRPCASARRLSTGHCSSTTAPGQEALRAAADRPEDPKAPPAHEPRPGVPGAQHNHDRPAPTRPRHGFRVGQVLSACLTVPGWLKSGVRYPCGNDQAEHTLTHRVRTGPVSVVAEGDWIGEFLGERIFIGAAGAGHRAACR